MTKARTPAGGKIREYAAKAWDELKGLAIVLLAVLFVHSFIGKPFYIPSESMMPVLLEGDRLVVSKYPYGYSFVSPTIPDPVGIVKAIVPGGDPGRWTVTLPPMKGRLFGNMPERGDIVIVTPPGKNEDYIKRVIGLPGDTISVRSGRLFINDVEVARRPMGNRHIPLDPNMRCGDNPPPRLPNYDMAARIEEDDDGRLVCVLPIFRETLPNGVSYDTIDLGVSPGDKFEPLLIPKGHLFLMGDNRDASADSRFALESDGLGGPVPVENIGGRAELLTFSMDGTAGLNPLSWFDALRDGRSFDSLRAKPDAPTPATGE